MLSDIVGNIKTVYVDLDGVLVNFMHGIYELFDVPQAFRNSSEDELSAVTRVPEKDIWRVIESKGPKWWRDLPYYPWYRQLRSAIIESGMEFVIATSPAKSAPSSGTGKMMWIKRYLSSTYINGDFVITNRKHRLARPDALLIDDSIEKVLTFQEAGGHAILFPQPYNREHKHQWLFDNPQELIQAIPSFRSWQS